MGLFGKNDELFEIMSRQRNKYRDMSESGSGSGSRSRSRSSSSSSSSGSFATRPQISWRRRRPKTDFYEVDGDALVVVDDGFSAVFGEETEEQRGAVASFAFRSDTLVVGGFLIVGLLVAAFLVGRNSGEPEGPTTEREVAVSVQSPNQASAVPAPLQADHEEAPGTESTAAPLPLSTGGLVNANMLPASFRGTSSTLNTSAPKPSPVPAVEQPVAKGQYALVVCCTTPKNAKHLAKWFNAEARSPIFGRKDLEAYSTRRGVVRIRGFVQQDDTVLKRVRATNDPLGSDTFHSAYYSKVR